MPTAVGPHLTSMRLSSSALRTWPGTRFRRGRLLVSCRMASQSALSGRAACPAIGRKSGVAANRANNIATAMLRIFLNDLVVAPGRNGRVNAVSLLQRLPNCCIKTPSSERLTVCP